MKLVQYSDRTGDLLILQERLNQTFGNIFKVINNEVFKNTWLPATDITETANQFEVKAELPGLKKEDVRIILTDNVLTIQGEKKDAPDEKKRACHRVERYQGTFVRTFALGTRIDAGNIKADFKDGVLTVLLPKAAAARTRTIEVQ